MPRFIRGDLSGRLESSSGRVRLALTNQRPETVLLGLEDTDRVGMTLVREFFLEDTV